METKTPLLLSLALGSGMILVFTGCNPTKSDSSTAAPPISEVESSSHDPMNHDHADHDHEGESAGKTDMEKMAETLAKFSEEDRQSAMKQHICPVSGEMLGTMGDPEQVEVEGQSVWICCDGCKDKLLADPEKYLAISCESCAEMLAASPENYLAKLMQMGVTPPALR